MQAFQRRPSEHKPKKPRSLPSRPNGSPKLNAAPQGLMGVQMHRKSSGLSKAGSSSDGCHTAPAGLTNPPEAYRLSDGLNAALKGRAWVQTA
ncbi:MULTISPECIES: hypothetical protein [Neisseria]|uniref:hypothetical protein n=1 Tax=Neisseria TaxID=482 RepID=UPI0010727CE7|nr:MULTISPECIES: hypothetical protein [Neisseria]MBF0802840.1 hypothetical protein [Neisseria sp. 19428wB4_WF04]TFU44623.1 hypothetical protein E4T99_00385 [Neisseria sp. WF04]